MPPPQGCSVFGDEAAGDHLPQEDAQPHDSQGGSNANNSKRASHSNNAQGQAQPNNSSGGGHTGPAQGASQAAGSAAGGAPPPPSPPRGPFGGFRGPYRENRRKSSSSKSPSSKAQSPPLSPDHPDVAQEAGESVANPASAADQGNSKAPHGDPDGSENFDDPPTRPTTPDSGRRQSEDHSASPKVTPPRRGAKSSPGEKEPGLLSGIDLVSVNVDAEDRPALEAAVASMYNDMMGDIQRVVDLEPDTVDNARIITDAALARLQQEEHAGINAALVQGVRQMIRTEHNSVVRRLGEQAEADPDQTTSNQAGAGQGQTTGGQGQTTRSPTSSQRRDDDNCPAKVLHVLDEEENDPMPYLVQWLNPGSGCPWEWVSGDRLRSTTLAEGEWRLTNGVGLLNGAEVERILNRMQESQLITPELLALIAQDEQAQGGGALGGQNPDTTIHPGWREDSPSEPEQPRLIVLYRVEEFGRFSFLVEWLEPGHPLKWALLSPGDEAYPPNIILADWHRHFDNGGGIPEGQARRMRDVIDIYNAGVDEEASGHSEGGSEAPGSEMSDPDVPNPSIGALRQQPLGFNEQTQEGQEDLPIDDESKQYDTDQETAAESGQGSQTKATSSQGRTSENQAQRLAAWGQIRELLHADGRRPDGRMELEIEVYLKAGHWRNPQAAYNEWLAGQPQRTQARELVRAYLNIDGIPQLSETLAEIEADLRDLAWKDPRGAYEQWQRTNADLLLNNPSSEVSYFDDPQDGPEREATPPDPNRIDRWLDNAETPEHAAAEAQAWRRPDITPTSSTGAHAGPEGYVIGAEATNWPASASGQQQQGGSGTLDTYADLPDYVTPESYDRADHPRIGPSPAPFPHGRLPDLVAQRSNNGAQGAGPGEDDVPTGFDDEVGNEGQQGGAEEPEEEGEKEDEQAPQPPPKRRRLNNGRAAAAQRAAASQPQVHRMTTRNRGPVTANTHRMGLRNRASNGRAVVAPTQYQSAPTAAPSPRLQPIRRRPGNRRRTGKATTSKGKTPSNAGVKKPKKATKTKKTPTRQQKKRTQQVQRASTSAVTQAQIQIQPPAPARAPNPQRTGQHMTRLRRNFDPAAVDPTWAVDPSSYDAISNRRKDKK